MFFALRAWVIPHLIRAEVYFLNDFSGHQKGIALRLCNRYVITANIPLSLSTPPLSKSL